VVGFTIGSRGEVPGKKENLRQEMIMMMMMMMMMMITTIIITTTTVRSRVSSVSIVSDHGLDDCAIGIRTPVGGKDFSSIRCVHTGSGAHPVSSPMGTGGKALLGLDADHLSPSSAEVMNEQGLYLLSLQAPPWRVVGLLNFFFNSNC
jgi:hypothetical protein